jgi:hypothetical protein
MYKEIAMSGLIESKILLIRGQKIMERKGIFIKREDCEDFISRLKTNLEKTGKRRRKHNPCYRWLNRQNRPKYFAGSGH